MIPFNVLVAADFLEEHSFGEAADYIRIPRMFLTGSRVYGTPHNQSDLDVVVQLSKEEWELLLSIGGSTAPASAAEEFPTLSIRFGNLNLICAKNDDWLEAWWRGTQDLIARKPVTRDEAVATFDKLFKEIKKKEKV